MTVTPIARPATNVHEPVRTAIPPLGPYARELWRRRPLIWHLARTQLKGENYDSVLGQAWIILDPLLMAGVYLLVRSILRPLGDGEETADLVAHLIVSVFLFQFTARTLNGGARSISGSRGLILNTSFPRSVFPVVHVLKGIFDLVPMLIVYAGIHLLLGQPIGASLVFLPLILVLQVVFVAGLVFLFAPLAVFFRDTTNFLPYITRLWMFTSPILFKVSEIPPRIKPFIQFNPLYWFFAAYERILEAQAPLVSQVVICAALAGLTFVAGAAVFLARERDFATRF